MRLSFAIFFCREIHQTVNFGVPMEKKKPAHKGGGEEGGKAMERVVLRNDGHNTKLEIDGVEIQNLYSVKIEKTPDGPIRIELSGSVTNEVLIET